MEKYNQFSKYLTNFLRPIIPDNIIRTNPIIIGNPRLNDSAVIGLVNTNRYVTPDIIAPATNIISFIFNNRSQMHLMFSVDKIVAKSC